MDRLPQTYRGGEVALVIDCADLGRSARFWTEVLGYTAPASIGRRYCKLLPADGRGLEVLLQRVPETKLGKNRLHLDLRTADLAAELARLLAAGATLLSQTPTEEDGWRWHILADPDGNEFCLLKPPSDAL